MALNQTEAAVIQNVIDKLSCKPHYDGQQSCSDEVYAALTGPAHLYLSTWVIPALEMLLPGDKCNPKQARQLSGV